MSVAQPKSSGIVTLTTDFGAADSYVGAMKGVLLALAPSARAEIGSIDLGEIAATYGVVAPDEPVAVFGSNGHVEVAVRSGSAAERFGDSAAVVVRW